MKIVLDIDKLLSQGKITSEQYDELKSLAERDTGSLALNLLIGFGVWATALGALALFPSAIPKGSRFASAHHCNSDSLFLPLVYTSRSDYNEIGAY